MISTHTSSDREPQKIARGWQTADCRDIHALSWLVLGYTWSPIVWKDGYRCQANFLHADFLALDFDDPQFPLAHAKRAFAGLTHLIGTTRNHQREKHGIVGDRYRVVVPFSERVTSVEVYRHNVKLALAMYDNADQSCKDGARPFFACREIIVIEDDGDPWDVETLPIVANRKVSTFRKTRGYLSSTTRAWLETALPHGTRKTTMFKLGCALRRAGLSYDDAMAAVDASETMRTGPSPTRYRQAAHDGYERERREETGS